MENPHIPGAVIEPELDLRQPQNPSDTPDTSGAFATKEPPATTHQERASHLNPEDLVPKQHVERHDTFDSLQSSFGQRSNTGFSVAMSTTTDYTEPDLTTLHDEDENEGEGTPALRSFAFPCPSDGVPSLPPTRTSSFAPDDHSFERGEDDDLSAPTNLINIRVSGPPRMRDVAERDQEGVPFRRSPSPLPDEAPVAGQSARDVGPLENRPSASGRLYPNVEVTPEEPELVQSETEHQESDHTLSQTGDESDADSSAAQSPGRDVVENVCDQVLKDAFQLGLEELATTDAAAAAYEATRYFLDELSRIVPTNSAAAWAPSQSQMTRGTGGYGQAPSPSQGGGGGHGTRRNGGGNKRPQNDEADDPNQDGYDDGNGSGGNGKRPKTDGQSSQAEDQNLSCPFRKRNSIKFNIRDFPSCATQSFPDISQLKRHVKLFHKQKSVSGFACPRCKQNMGSKDAYDRHLAVTRALICEVQATPSSQDPEDGINAKTEDLLNGRRANSKVDSWDILWKTLFPCDETSDIPHPEFIPPIELEEVHSSFRLPSTLASLRLLLASLPPSPSPDDLIPLFTQHIDSVFATCRHLTTGSLPHPKRRRRAPQKPKSAAPPTPAPSDLSLRPVPYDGDSSPSSAISGGSSWYLQGQGQHISPVVNYHDLLTTESSAASMILSPNIGGGDDLSPAGGFGPESLSPSPAGFDGTPLFPTTTAVGVGGGYGGGGGPFRDQFGGTGGGMMGYGGAGGQGAPGGGRMVGVPFQIATSMAMHPHAHAQAQAHSQALEEVVPTTAIDRSGGFGFGGQHMGHGSGGGHRGY